MGIKKTITDSNTDVPMEYHVILMLTQSWLNNTTTVTLASYYSKDTFKRGGRPLNQDQMMLPGIAPRGVDVIDWAQEQMIRAVDPSETVDTNQFLNRLLLSGGEIVDHEPNDTAPVVDRPGVAQADAQAEADAQK
jgi:hypothetical protein